MLKKIYWNIVELDQQNCTVHDKYNKLITISVATINDYHNA